MAMLEDMIVGVGDLARVVFVLEKSCESDEVTEPTLTGNRLVACSLEFHFVKKFSST